MAVSQTKTRLEGWSNGVLLAGQKPNVSSAGTDLQLKPLYLLDRCARQKSKYSEQGSLCFVLSKRSTHLYEKPFADLVISAVQDRGPLPSGHLFLA